MAREKRPAETSTTSYCKRQKTFNNDSNLSSPCKRDENESEMTHDGVPDDEERLTQEIQLKLDKLKVDHIRRNKVSKEFEEKIKKEQARITRNIESATGTIEGQRGGFRTCIIPILDSALEDPSLEPNILSQDQDFLTIGPILEPAVLQKANSVLSSCSDLIACYKEATSISTMTSSTSGVRETFETDRDETMKAFESAKKMTINQLQAGLADKTEDMRDRYNLDDDEYHLARKVLARGKGGKLNNTSMKIGSLLYDFGKIVGKLQNMADY